MKIGIFLCWREHLARDYFYTLLCVHERDVRASCRFNVKLQFHILIGTNR